MNTLRARGGRGSTAHALSLAVNVSLLAGCLPREWVLRPDAVADTAASPDVPDAPSTTDAMDAMDVTDVLDVTDATDATIDAPADERTDAPMDAPARDEGADAPPPDAPDAVADAVVADAPADAPVVPSTWTLGEHVAARPQVNALPGNTPVSGATSTCPPGYVIVGIEGTAAETNGYLSNLRPMCRRLRADGTLTPVDRPATWLPTPGPVRGRPSTVYCPAGQFVVGFNVITGTTEHVAPVVANVGLQCAPVGGLPRSGEFLRARGGMRTTESQMLCPRGTAVDELYIRYGAVIGILEAHCRELIPTPCDGPCPEVPLATCDGAGTCRTAPAGWSLTGDRCAWEAPGTSFTWDTTMLPAWTGGEPGLRLFTFPRHSGSDPTLTRAEVVFSETGPDCPTTDGQSLWVYCGSAQGPLRSLVYNRDFTESAAPIVFECEGGSTVTATQGRSPTTGDCTRTLTVRRFYVDPQPGACAAVF